MDSSPPEAAADAEPAHPTPRPTPRRDSDTRRSRRGHAARARPPRRHRADRPAALGPDARHRSLRRGARPGRRRSASGWPASRSRRSTRARSNARPRPPRRSRPTTGSRSARCPASSRPTTASGPAASSPTSPRRICGRGAARAVAGALPRRRVARRDAGRAWSTALEAVVADHPGEIVVVVSHADPIKAAIAHYTGVHLDLFQRIVVSPASVTVFDVHGSRRRDAEVQRHRHPRRAPAAARGQGAGEPDEKPEESRPRARLTPPGASRGNTEMPDPIELDQVDGLGTGAVGEPGAARVLHPGAQRGHASSPCSSRRSRSRCSRPRRSRSSTASPTSIPRTPITLPSDCRATLHEPTVPLFRARLIGLGFDPERELVLLELRERSADEDDDDDGEALDEALDDRRRRGRRRGRLRRPALRDPRRRCGRWRRAARRPSPAGRPPCPLCDMPMDPAGHRCPRWN